MDPMTAVTHAFAAGARTRKEVVLSTGLDSDVVDAVVDVLIRTRALEVHALKFECGAGGCGNCVQDQTCSPGPVAINLRRYP